MERENQKLEAIRRMKALHLAKNVIKDFEKDNVVYYSERQNKFFDGILYWVSNEPEYVKIIKDFEAKHNALVYHAQLTHTDLGDMLALLFVGEDEKEWSGELELDQGDNSAFSYVVNLNTPEYSEFGCIGIVPKNGGVTRTY